MGKPKPKGEEKMATKIEIWNPERGFGFIRVDGKRVFIHAKSVKPRPAAGADLTDHLVDEVKVDWQAPKGPAVKFAFDLTANEELHQKEEAEEKERKVRWDRLLQTADEIGAQLRGFRELFFAELEKAAAVANEDPSDRWLEVQLGEGMREFLTARTSVEIRVGELSIGVWYVRVQSMKLSNHLPLRGWLWEVKANYTSGLSVVDNRERIASQIAAERRETLLEAVKQEPFYSLSNVRLGRYLWVMKDGRILLYDEPLAKEEKDLVLPILRERGLIEA